MLLRHRASGHWMPPSLQEEPLWGLNNLVVTSKTHHQLGNIAKMSRETMAEHRTCMISFLTASGKRNIAFNRKGCVVPIAATIKSVIKQRMRCNKFHNRQRTARQVT